MEMSHSFKCLCDQYPATSLMMTSPSRVDNLQGLPDGRLHGRMVNLAEVGCWEWMLEPTYLGPQSERPEKRAPS